MFERSGTKKTSATNESRAMPGRKMVRFAWISQHTQRKPTLKVAQVIMQVLGGKWMRTKLEGWACIAQAETTITVEEAASHF